MPGKKVTLLSTDSADVNEADGLHTIPAEYLHSLGPIGLSPSKLELKVGVPIMLLRNIDSARGLCNGTRLVVVRIGGYMLQARLANKPDGPLELIPRFTLSTQDELPFTLTRKQFPVKLCFSMTINKSQGQPLKYVGIDLRQPPFMHGQLYVALLFPTFQSFCQKAQIQPTMLSTQSYYFTNMPTYVTYHQSLLKKKSQKKAFILLYFILRCTIGTNKERLQQPISQSSRCNCY